MDVVQKSFSTKGSLKDWQIFYKKYFGISKDFSEIKIPVSKTGFNTLVVVIKEISSRDIFLDHIKFLRGSHKADISLDAADDYSDRSSVSGDYAIWINDSREPDIRLNKSTLSLLPHYSFITLREELLIILKHSSKCDSLINNYTYSICAGSIFPDGRVPIISCINQSGVNISSVDIHTYGEIFGHRQVVS